MEKLKICLVDYGRGKYYTYTDPKGREHPVIEMNKDMLEFDIDLFCWVFQHELEHYEFYQDRKNKGKSSFHLDMKQMIPTPYNLENTFKLREFENKFPDHAKKDFLLVKDNYQGDED